MSVNFSLIIPCYNEAKNLPALITRLSEVFKHSDIEIILVDNGSRDESPRILAEQLTDKPNLRTLRIENNQGYGFGILSGLHAAKGKFIGWTHADMQTDPLDALKAFELIESKNFDTKLYLKGKRYGRSLFDVFFTVGMAIFVSIILRTRLWDVNAQPNIFSRQFFDTWNHPPHDFSLDLFVYYHAHQQSLEIRRIPVYFGKRLHGISSWNVGLGAKYKFIKRTIDFTLRLKKSLTRNII